MMRNGFKIWCVKGVSIAFALFFLTALFPHPGIAATITSTNPTNGNTISGVYNCSVNDAGGAYPTVISLDGSLLGYMNNASATKRFYNLDTRGYADGNHVITFDSKGGTGGENIVTVSVKFDNNAPTITNAVITYPTWQTAAKINDSIYVTCTVSDSVSGIASVFINGSTVGSGYKQMYDDGLHHDSAVSDGIYGSDTMKVNVTDGYYNIILTAKDNQGNTVNKQLVALVDDFPPEVVKTNVTYPVGQTAAKQGDYVHVTAQVSDSMISRSIPIDYVLVNDNSGSMADPMAGTTLRKYQVVKNAANSFVNSSNMPPDRGAIYWFNSPSGPDNIVQQQAFTSSKTLVKNAIAAIPAPNGGTPLYHAIMTCDNYAVANGWSNHSKAVIALTDGYQEPTIDRYPSYAAVMNAYNKSVRTFVIGIGVDTPGNFDKGYMVNVSNYGGGTPYWVGKVQYSTQYYFAPNPATLNKIYANISQTLKRNTNAPYGISRVLLDATQLGLSTTIVLYDDGAHNDGLANDNIYGSDPLQVMTSIPSPGVKVSLPVDAYDDAGNKAQLPANVTLDNTPPTISAITVTYPTGQSSVSDGGSVMFAISTKDTVSGISLVTFNLTAVGGSPTQATYAGGIGYQTSFVTVSTGNKTGLLTVWAHVRDGAGNDVWQSMNVKVDNSHLSVAMSAPGTVVGAYQYVSGKFTFRASASDPSAVGQVAITLFGLTVPMAYNSATGYYEYTTDTTATSDGFYNVSAAFESTTGVILNTATVMFGVDNNAPSMTVNYPQNGASLKGNNISLNISVYDLFLDKVQYNIDGNGWNDYTVNINSTLYPDGSHTLQIEATDFAGHVALVTYTIYIDNNLPVTVLNTPSAGSGISGMFDFKVTASSAAGISSVALKFNGSSKTFVLNPSTGYYEYLMDTTAYKDGVYNATVTAYDSGTPAQSTTIGPIFFKIDNSIPKIIFKNPVANGYVGANAALTLGITAIDSFLVDLEYNVDGNGWATMATPLDTMVIPDGMHNMTVKAVNAAGHVTIQTIQFYVDKYAPVCQSESPSDGGFANGIYMFKAIATSYVGLDSVKYSIVTISTNVTVASGNMTYDASSGQYVCSFDTVTIPDNAYNLIMTASDRFGITTTETTKFYVDNNLPDIYVTYPQENGYVQDIVNLSANVTYVVMFPHSPPTATYSIDGLGTTDLMIPWNTTAFADGPHTITFTVTDGGGRFMTKDVHVSVDNHPPACVVAAPAYVPPSQAPLYETISGTYTFKVAASSAVGLSAVNLTIPGLIGPMPLSYNPSTGYYEYTIDTMTLPHAEDGQYVAIANAIDPAGRNTTSIPVNFNLDNNAPVVSMIMPTNNMHISGETPIMLMITGEPSTIPTSDLPAWYDIDGNGWQDLRTVAPYTTINSNASQLDDGRHTLSVKVMDVAKHETIVTINIMVQNHPPELTINTPNTNEFIQGIYNLQVDAIDPVGILSVVGILQSKTGSYLTNLTFTYNQQNGYYEYSLDTAVLTDGGYSLTVQATNSAWVSVKTVDFKVDNHAPSLAVNTPLEGQYVSGKCRINIYANDTYMASVQYNIDGNSWIMAIGNIVYNIIWDSTAVMDGKHTLNVLATDLAGHQTLHTTDILVDNTPPSVLVESPADNQYLSGIFPIKVMAQDTMGIDHVTLSVIKYNEAVLTDNLLINAATQEYEYNFNTSSIPDGHAQIVISAFDHANHMTNSTMNVTIDNTPPTIILVEPKSGSNVEGAIVFKAQVSDALSGVNKVELYIDSEKIWVEMLNSNTSLYSFTWFTSTQDNGVHVYGVRATDNLGNTRELTSTVTVGNVQEKDYLGMILRALPLMIFIFVILLIILLLVLVKRGTFQRWMKTGKVEEKPAKVDKTDKPTRFDKPKQKESELISSVKKVKMSKSGEQKPAEPEKKAQVPEKNTDKPADKPAVSPEKKSDMLDMGEEIENK